MFHILILINNALSKVDFMRLDLQEQIMLFGYDTTHILSVEVLEFIASTRTRKAPFFVDISPAFLYNNNSLKKIFNFIKKTEVEGLCIDLKYYTSSIVKKLHFENINVIATTTMVDENFEKIKDSSVEMQAQGVKAIILEQYPQSFVENMQKTLSIPVLSDTPAKSDGVYCKLSKLIGLENNSNKMLNASELITQTVQDFVLMNKQ